MKRYIKMTSLGLIILLILQIMIPVLTNIEIDTSYAMTMISYFKEATDQNVVGRDGTTTPTTYKFSVYTNTSISNSKYVVYSNAVQANDGKLYDLVIYPFKGATNALVGTSTTPHLGTLNGYAGYKLVITQHGNINSPVEMKVMLGINDLDLNEYVILPSNFSVVHKGNKLNESESTSPQGKKYKGTADANNNNQMYNTNCIMGNITIPTNGLIIYYGATGYHSALLAFDSIKEYIENNAYAIEFNPNGGSGTPDTIIKFGTDTSTVMGDISSTVPTRSGYTFKGWSASSSWSSRRIAYTENSGGSVAKDGTTATTTGSSWTYAAYCTNTGGNSSNRTLTLYAQWEAIEYSHTLAYNANGGNSAPSSSTVTNTSSTYSMRISNTKPTRTGYTFTGWNTNASGTGSNYSSGGSISVGANATVTLYAKWEINASTLKVNPNGGSWNGSTAEQSFTQNYNTTKSIAVPSREGYTFTGWTKEGTSGSLSSTTSAATYTFGTTNGAIDTITATWQKNQYELTVEPNKGIWEGSTENQRFTLDYEGTKEIPVPTRNGYSFTKWTLAGEGSKIDSIDANSSRFTMGYEDARLTAEWNLITHSIIGNVIWNDQANKYKSRPENVNVTLNSDEEITEEGALQTPNTKQVIEGNYQFEKLQTKKTKDNTNYTYTVNQNKVPGYETIVNGYNITNNLILPKYTSQITMRPLNSFNNKLLKNGQAKIVGIVTADSNNINKVGAYNEEVTFQIDSGVEIAKDSIKIYYIDKEGTEKELKNYTLNNNELKVNFESNKTSHITAGDSLRIELNGTLKELKQYVSRISYSGFLRDYETGDNTNINLGTLTVATNDIAEDAGSIVEEQLPEANIQIKKVDSITKEKLTDATFTLYEWDGNNYVEKEIIKDIDKDGIYTSKAHRWSFTNEGRYKIEETGIPANHKDAKFSMEYTLDQLKREDYTIQIDYNHPNYMIHYEEEPEGLNKTEGIVENEPYKVKAEITKVDKETRRVIEAEGIFTIYEWNKQTQNYEEYVSYINGNKVMMVRQEDKTYLSSEWLYYTPNNEGKYRIIETQAPEGYYPEHDNNNERKAYDINIIEEIEDGTYTNEGTIKIESEKGKGVLENTRQKIEIVIHNKDEETEEKRTGGKYVLYTREEIPYTNELGETQIIPANEKLVVLTANEEGKIEINKDLNIDLLRGKYYLKEIEAPKGYVLQEKELEIDAMQEVLAEIIHIEKDFYGIRTKLAIKEINEENEITTGSEFEIRRKDTGEVVESFTTKGEEDKFEKLETNVEYVVLETKAIPGYTTAKEVNFVIKENGKLWIEGEEQEENVIIIRDYTTKLNIHLKDIETNEYVKGAILQIIQKIEDKEEIVAEWKTQEAGQKIYRLPVGEYTIREVRLPENSGYATIEEQAITVIDTIEEQQVELKQEFTKIRIEIVDEETKEKIDNLEITIIDKESKKEVAKTKGENGQKEENMITITENEEGYYLERLPIGEYIIKETTPEGYKEVEEVEMKVEDTEKLQIVHIENKRLIYDMQVEKELVSITIDGEKKVVPKGELQKVEVKESKIKTADIRLEYIIRVSNVGETRATIGTIIDNIPEGFKLVSTDWKQEGRKAIYNAEKEELKPTESKEVRIMLKWENNESNFGEKKNTAELKGSTNPYGYKDNKEDNNIGEEITIFSIKTGTETGIIIMKGMTITLLATMMICLLVGIEITILKRNKQH